ncbi:MAG: DNA recombination protein RmuC [Candidatus Pacebacteria bacterium]|jgi:DNA recombination protein RmuC|nr:DNA recombination protein RmuC [Candidatus Paceibacterota bacterium]
MNLVIMISLALLILLVSFLLYFLLKKSQNSENDEKILDEKLESTINKVFGMTANKIAQQSKSILQSEQDLLKTDLNNKQAIIEKLVKQLKEDLDIRQKEIREIEKKQIDKIGRVATAVEDHRILTKDLKISTEKLAKILDNNQTRGAWGERIIEDLLQANGLLEGVHYVRQVKQGASNLKPDITLLLPDKRNVPVDVKFPYQEIQKMSNTESKAEKKIHLQQFSRDLKVKVDKVAEYISPESDTLDYAILFVPNEMIFSFINQKLPEIIDEALAKKVILCSPFSFLVVARTVMESYRNFMVGKKIQEVIKQVEAFSAEWIKFDDEFQKFGRSIEGLQKNFDSISTTRKKQMERRIHKIEEYRSGSGKLLSDNKNS